jgi:hypothetical protein
LGHLTSAQFDQWVKPESMVEMKIRVAKKKVSLAAITNKNARRRKSVGDWSTKKDFCRGIKRFRACTESGLKVKRSLIFHDSP